MKTNQNARSLALDLLIKAERSKQFSNIALDKALEKCDLETADRRLVSALFYGVIERRLTLDYRLAALSSRPLSDIDEHTLTVLRLGLYQLIFMDKIPPHAAINESVSLCPKRTSGFVNAILRAHSRTPKTPLPPKDSYGVAHLSIKFSVCEPLVKRFVEAYGFDASHEILSAFCDTPKTTLRVNTLKVSREELAARIDGAEPTEVSPHGLRVKGSVRELYGFNDGLFTVQDEASQICVEALDAKAGMKVMDICACPGSKSFGAAINMNNDGEILSFDLHQRKLSLILSGAERLGIDIIKVAEQDGRKPLAEHFSTADRVICDVPCSGFGVLAKKPELRYKDPTESAALPDIQLDILKNACQYVKDGGVLVYSTCTVFPEENLQNVERFLKLHSEFELTPFSVGELNAKDGYITLLPNEHHTDGFFIAKLTKRTKNAN